MDGQDEGRTGLAALDALTGKQRQVLDLLIEHKTSKEIARCLGISPHTVDQRIQFAKDKLGTRTRSEAAQVYRQLLETYGQMTYEPASIADPLPMSDQGRGAQDSLPAPSQQRFRSRQQDEPEADFQVAPELFEGRQGTIVRMGAILAIAVLVVLVVLGGLAIFNQLSQLMKR